MTPDEFTRRKAIDLLKSKVLTDRELARFLAELAYQAHGEAAIIKMQILQHKRVEECG